MSNPDVITRMLFGDDYINKSELLKQDLLEIEKKNILYFKSMPPKYKEHDKHDFLHNHYTIFTSDNNINFRFIEDCVLPMDIQNECLAAFRNRFGNQ